MSIDKLFEIIPNEIMEKYRTYVEKGIEAKHYGGTFEDLANSPYTFFTFAEEGALQVQNATKRSECAYCGINEDLIIIRGYIGGYSQMHSDRAKATREQRKR